MKSYGIVAVFDNAEDLIRAVRASYAAGFRRMETYSPYPVPEVDSFLPGWELLSPVAFISGVAGGVLGFGVQYYIAVALYPTNIGGRPLNSWPAFAVIAFEMVVLFALLAVFASALFFEKLPRLYQPLYRTPDSVERLRDRFALCIEATDPLFFSKHPYSFLTSLDPLHVWQVTYD